LNKENERKAAKAMESLNVTAAPAALKEGDVELIVSLSILSSGVVGIGISSSEMADERSDKLGVRNPKLRRHYVRIKGI